MIRKKYQAYAYLARGHWVKPAKKVEEMGDYSKKEYEQESAFVFEQWFVFSDYFPEPTSNISLNDKLNLIDLEMTSRRYGEDVKSAHDDIAIRNQWNIDTTTALGISKHLHESIYYDVNGRSQTKSKIGLWRTCDSAKTGGSKMSSSFFITPKSKDYAYFAKLFGAENAEALFVEFDEKEDENINEAFVADKILEVRRAVIESDDSFSLYCGKSLSGKLELNKKGKLSDAIDAEEVEKMKQAVKDIEEKIVNSGAARRLPSAPSANPNTHRVPTDGYGYNNPYAGQSYQNSSGSGLGWIILIIIGAVILIAMFSH